MKTAHKLKLTAGHVYREEEMTAAAQALSDAQQREWFVLQAAKERLTMPSDLSTFIRASWPIIEPHTEYLHNWHIDAMSEYLQAVRDCQITRLIINIPPRYMKSTVATIDFPCWWWTSQPAERFICASYSDKLAKAHSLARRAIIQSSWYQDRWGDIVQLADDQNEKSLFKNTTEGAMIAVPVGGSITGMGGNCIIIDDPINPDEAESEAERAAALHFISNTLSTRLNDKKKGRIVIVMQRLHEKDPTGDALARGGWEHLKLPAIAEKKQTIIFPKTGRIKTREIGDVLWDDREGMRELNIMKLVMTETGFSGQYQQEPSPSEGTVFKRSWWRYYGGTSGNALPDRFDYVCDSWDLSFKDTVTSDRVAGIKIAVRDRSIYIRDIVADRMGFSESCLAINALASMGDRPHEVLVEDKANGPAVIETLKKILFQVNAVNPEGGKKSRANSAQPTVKAGCVYLPIEHPKCMEFVEELARFTGRDGETDDLVDAFTQAIIRIVIMGGGLFQWVAEKYDGDEELQARMRDEEQRKEQNLSHSRSELTDKMIAAVLSGSQLQCGREQWTDQFRKFFKIAAQQMLESGDARCATIATEIKRLDTLFNVK